jgi:3-phenylpropionate/cinnamic acid dioxygenase small subunit
LDAAVDASVRARDEITAIVHRYAWLLDRGDVDGVLDLFTRATWRSATTGTVLRSREELRPVYQALVPTDGPIRTRHLMHNLVIEHDDGADDARARCSYTVLEGGEPGAPVRILLVGRYDDTYHRGPDGWHLTDRVFHVDLDATSPRRSRPLAHIPSPASPPGGARRRRSQDGSE